MNFKIKQDFLWIFLAATLILSLGSLPTWAGYWAETQDLRFRGLFFDTQDYAVHISTMEAGAHGDTTYQFRFTTEPHTSAYLKLFYIALGHVSRIFHLSLEVTYEFARWLFGYMALFSLYALMKRIFSNPFWARTAFLLASIGSGLGWLQLVFNWVPGTVTPIDFWLIDCYVFFGLAVFPHFAFITIGMCITLSLWLDYLDTPRWQTITKIIIMVLLVQFTNPVGLATVNVALAGASFASWWKDGKINWKIFFALVILATTQLPLLIYNGIILNADPVWSQFTAQNKTLSPAPIYYLWGLAPFLPFAIIGILAFFKNKSKSLGASLLWVMSGFIFAYIPLLVQRRFTHNITIPLAILATQGLISMFETEADQSPAMKRWRPGLVTLFLIIASFSSIQLSLGRILYTQTYPPELYYPASLNSAVVWLRKHAQYNDFVLATEETSQVLTQKAGTRAYLGHEMETLGYEEKKILVNEYFNGKNNIAISPIQWVVYGPYEQAINPSFEPVGLELVYEEQSLKIYKVK